MRFPLQALVLGPGPFRIPSRHGLLPLRGPMTWTRDTFPFSELTRPSSPALLVLGQSLGSGPGGTSGPCRWPLAGAVGLGCSEGTLGSCVAKVRELFSLSLSLAVTLDQSWVKKKDRRRLLHLRRFAGRPCLYLLAVLLLEAAQHRLEAALQCLLSGPALKQRFGRLQNAPS